MTNGAMAVDHPNGDSRNLSVRQEKFENWARSEYGLSEDDLKKPYDGRYFWERTSDLWASWQGSQESASGWLIEVCALPKAMWLRADGSVTDDVNIALQFSREQDASSFLEVFMKAKFGDDVISVYKRRLGADCYAVAEHP